MEKEQQKKLLTEIMEEDQKNGLYDNRIGDTNKMVTMKLYTEEQVRIAMSEARYAFTTMMDTGRK